MVRLFPFIAFPMEVLLPDKYFHIKTFNQSHFSYPLLPGRVKVIEVCLEAFTFRFAGALAHTNC